MRFHHSCLALAGLGLTALAVPSRSQGLNGQPVTVTYRAPNTATVAANLGTQGVTPAGATFTPLLGVTTVVTPTQIRFTEALATSTGFTSAAFNGFVVSETGSTPAPIAGFLVNPATNVPGFDLSRVSFDSTDIFANFQGLVLTGGQNVTLDIVTAAPVPEASTTVSLGLLLALGAGGLVIAARRKRTNTKASA